MSIFFFDSMAHYNTVAQMQTKWDYIHGGSALSASSGAFGYYGIHPGDDSNSMLINFPSVTTLELSCYFIAVSQFGKFMEFRTTAGLQITSNIYSDGTIEFLRGTSSGISAVSAAAAISFGVQHHLYVKIVFSNTVGQVVCKIDGTTVINTAANKDTAEQTAEDCTQLRLFGGGSTNVANAIFSHVALADTAGDIPGRPRVQAVFADGAGNYSQWNLQGAATHYGAINEQFPDEDTSYVYESTVGDRDSYTYSNFLSSTDTVLAVAVVPRARTDDGASRTMKTFVRAGGVDYDHANAESVPGSYGYLQQIFQVNPATGVAWTPAEVNAIEAGIKVVS